jgi:dihydroneopterin aldolase
VDRIVIRDLRIRCVVGVLPRERTTPQDLLVSLEVGADLAPAARSGSLEHTLDYAELARQTRELVVAGRFRLLETMAEDLAACALADRRAASVRVTVRKPAAIAGARDAGVEIARER